MYVYLYTYPVYIDTCVYILYIHMYVCIHAMGMKILCVHMYVYICMCVHGLDLNFL